MPQRTIASGDTFERHLEVTEPCTLYFSFASDDASLLTFSVLLRAKGKDMRLLPASSYAELKGEVLLPGPGTAIARWHNAATSWFWYSAATVTYSLSCERPTAPPPNRGRAAAASAVASAAAPSGTPGQPAPPPNSSSYNEQMAKAVEDALAKAMSETIKGRAQQRLTRMAHSI